MCTPVLKVSPYNSVLTSATWRWGAKNVCRKCPAVGRVKVKDEQVAWLDIPGRDSYWFCSYLENDLVCIAIRMAQRCAFAKSSMNLILGQY